MTSFTVSLHMNLRPSILVEISSVNVHVSTRGEIGTGCRKWKVNKPGREFMTDVIVLTTSIRHSPCIVRTPAFYAG